jgi:FMN phosphatase YigB (HAD superfamily)
LEKQFGNINTNNEYYNWATKETNLSKEEIKNIIKNIVENIYELREPDIFEHLPKVKLAIASNQLSHINDWLSKTGIKDKFDCILISADIGIEKPNKEFYEKLI